MLHILDLHSSSFQNEVVCIHRLSKQLSHHYEVKNPRVQLLAENSYLMDAWVGNSVEQRWVATQFISTTLNGPWHELEPDTSSFPLLQTPPQSPLQFTHPVQLSEKCFLLIGDHYSSGPSEDAVQRIFFAVSASLAGLFQPLTLSPVFPTPENKTSQAGHPSIVVVGRTMKIFYHCQVANGQPWHLRSITYNLHQLHKIITQQWHEMAPSPTQLNTAQATAHPALPLYYPTQQPRRYAILSV